MASESTTVATPFTTAVEIASTLRRAAKAWSSIVVVAIIKAATSLCTFGFFLCLAADLVEFALVVLPLLAKTCVVHRDEGAAVALVLLHRQVCEFVSRKVPLRNILATAELL